MHIQSKEKKCHSLTKFELVSYINYALDKKILNGVSESGPSYGALVTVCAAPTDHDQHPARYQIRRPHTNSTLDTVEQQDFLIHIIENLCGLQVTAE